MAVMGGTFLGLQVFLVKLSDGITLASIAAGEQFVLNFLLGGLLMRLCENLACSQLPKLQAIFLAILIPDAINISCTFTIHYFDEGDVSPLYSTLPTIIFATSAYVWWALRKRRMMKDKK